MIDEANIHGGSKDALLDLQPERGHIVDGLEEKVVGPLRLSSVYEGRSIAFSTVAIEGKLGNNQNLPLPVLKGEVHLSLLVFKYP